jgi:hypothetical protein
MVEDVASDRMRVPGFIAQLALRLMSSQIEQRVHFDILKVKPASFARHCSVPCNFIIGKEDKLVFPRRVLEIFDAYLGKQKHLIHSNGDHSSEREPEVLKQCYAFILQEISKNFYQNQKVEEMRPPLLERTTGDGLERFKDHFLAKYDQMVGHHLKRLNTGHTYSRGTYNFDFYLDETRNEERSANHVDHTDEYEQWEASSGWNQANHRPHGSQSEKSFSLFLRKEDATYGSTQDFSDSTKDDLQTYVKELSKGLHAAGIKTDK